MWYMMYHALMGGGGEGWRRVTGLNMVTGGG